MVAGSQVAAWDAAARLNLVVVTGIRWDGEAQVLVISTMAVPSVARAYQRGDLSAIASFDRIDEEEAVEKLAFQPLRT